MDWILSCTKLSCAIKMYVYVVYFDLMQHNIVLCSKKIEAFVYIKDNFEVE